mmetsp:Transcript_32742/g.54283  ORF Transcript_32742/g.54283 Transcript_32742/m.54283 type:complete len:412 (-) Transcript_32742:838-2073(-)
MYSCTSTGSCRLRFFAFTGQHPAVRMNEYASSRGATGGPASCVWLTSSSLPPRRSPPPPPLPVFELLSDFFFPKPSFPRSVFFLTGLYAPAELEPTAKSAPPFRAAPAGSAAPGARASHRRYSPFRSSLMLLSMNIRCRPEMNSKPAYSLSLPSISSSASSLTLVPSASRWARSRAYTLWNTSLSPTNWNRKAARPRAACRSSSATRGAPPPPPLPLSRKRCACRASISGAPSIAFTNTRLAWSSTSKNSLASRNASFTSAWCCQYTPSAAATTCSELTPPPGPGVAAASPGPAPHAGRTPPPAATAPVGGLNAFTTLSPSAWMCSRTTSCSRAMPSSLTSRISAYIRRRSAVRGPPSAASMPFASSRMRSSGCTTRAASTARRTRRTLSRFRQARQRTSSSWMSFSASAR